MTTEIVIIPTPYIHNAYNLLRFFVIRGVIHYFIPFPLSFPFLSLYLWYIIDRLYNHIHINKAICYLNYLNIGHKRTREGVLFFI
jgi:hypothetical protein